MKKYLKNTETGILIEKTENLSGIFDNQPWREATTNEVKEFLKNKIIININLESKQRINNSLSSVDINGAQVISETINAIKIKAAELETSLNDLTQAKLESFEVNKNSNWE